MFPGPHPRGGGSASSDSPVARGAAEPTDRPVPSLSHFGPSTVASPLLRFCVSLRSFGQLRAPATKAGGRRYPSIPTPATFAVASAPSVRTRGVPRRRRAPRRDPAAVGPPDRTSVVWGRALWVGGRA